MYLHRKLTPDRIGSLKPLMLDKEICLEAFIVHCLGIAAFWGQEADP